MKLKRWTHPAVRGGVVALLFAGYPWVVIALERFVTGPAMMVALLPVLATTMLYGTRAGVVAVGVALFINQAIARRLRMLDPELMPRAALIAAIAMLVLVFGSGVLRRLWQRVRRANEALAQANLALAEEAQLRSQMAAELRANAELYSSLLNSMAEGVGLFDAEDRFVFGNAAAEQLFGVASGQLVGRCLRDWVDTDGVEALEAARHRRLQGGGAYQLTTRREGGESRLLLITETLLESSPADSARVLRVMHDVTLRERLEKEQRELAGQVQRAQAMQSLGVLAGGVAHDFNNLLTGVLGHAQLAILRLDRSSPEDARQSLREIQDFAREAATLAKQMLAYAGKGTLVTEALDVASVAGEALRLVQSTVAARASLEHAVASDLPSVRGDRTQLRQVIVNLLMNAVESLGEGRGTVRLTLDCQELGPDQLDGIWRPERPPSGKCVVLSVADDGQGMSEETLSRIFEPYFSTKVAGRGMGLAATLGIIRAHRGHVGVRSALGGGSTFRILLPPESVPASVPAGVPASVSSPEKPVRGEGVILLIDDERSVRSTASLMLEELGYEVLVAGSGREGLERLAADSARVCLVLLDLTMPDMDGHETLSEIRRAGHTVPVLLISGYHRGDVAPLLRQRGVVGFLQKPLQLEQLARSVWNALRCGVESDERAQSRTACS